MDCDDFYPMFLLYNRDRLTGFGWVAQGNADSSRYEHPSPNRLKVSQVQKRSSIQLYTDEFLTPCTLWRYRSWVAIAIGLYAYVSTVYYSEHSAPNLFSLKCHPSRLPKHASGFLHIRLTGFFLRPIG